MATDARAVAVKRCVSDIEVADFVAIDLEFSGLFLKPERERRELTLSEYFTKCVESIPQFMPLQLGICCGRRLSDGIAGGRWEVRVHEFNLWSQDRRIFSSDMQSLRFLRAHGFDFNKYFEQGYAFERLRPTPLSTADGSGTPAAPLRRPPATHVTHVLAALREAKIPLVVHNGLLDMLHVYNKFFGELPSTATEFADVWRSEFPTFFDTRLIALEGRSEAFRHPSAFNLEQLHQHLSAIPQGDVPMQFERGGPASAGGAAHSSAGYDAMLTAEVFIMEMDLLLRSSAVRDQGSAKRRKIDTPDMFADPAASESSDKFRVVAGDDAEGWTTVSGSGRKRAKPVLLSRYANAQLEGTSNATVSVFTSATVLESHTVCRQFRNRVAIVGASPGSLNLGPPETRGAMPSGPGLPSKSNISALDFIPSPTR